MSAITAVASRWTLSAGTLVALGGGLVLYQMTSLVLGPAGSREFHVSLTIPAIDVSEPSLSLASGVNLMLGSRVVPAPAQVLRRPTTSHWAPSTPVTHRSAAPVAPKPAPVATTPAVVPLSPVGLPGSPPDERVDAHNHHDGD